MAYTSRQIPLTVPLGQAARWGRAVAGSKAAALGALVVAGFPVPEGVVLTTAAFAGAVGHDSGAASLGAAPRGAGDADAVGKGIRIPAAVRADIDALAAVFTDTVLAVRSSAVAEDGADTAAAGRYRTVLGVRGAPELRAAVAQCWSSAAGIERRRIIRVGGIRRMPTASPMAVLVQRQVTADAAGVAFTADPVTGQRDRVVISAVTGLGDGVTDGRADADEWAVVDDVAHPVRVRQGALTAGQARQVAALARRVEQHAGCPQDVEWALADGRLVVLQARPITALPTAPAATLPPGRPWEKDLDRYAEPFTALGASIAPAMVAAGLSRAFHDAGSLTDRVETCEIAGEVYTAVMAPGTRGTAPPPWWVLAVLARVHPGMRAACRRARHAADAEAIRARITRWRTVDAPALDAAAAHLRQVDLGALDDAALAAHLRRVRDHAAHAMSTHFELTVPETLPIYRLADVCRVELGWPLAETFALLGGASPASSAPADEMRRLAASVPPDECAAIAAHSGSALDDLGRFAPAFAAGFARWCERFAALGITDDPGAAVYGERPALLERLVRGAAEGIAHAGAAEGAVTVGGLAAAAAADATAVDAAAAAIARARSALAGRPASHRRRFEVALRDAREAHGVRDDVAVRTGSAFGGILRLTVLEAGARLMTHGALGRAEDAAQLPFDDLCGALDGTLDDARIAQIVARSLGERAWVRLHPGPVRVEPRAAMPDLRGLPRAAREVNRALIWAHDAGRIDAGDPVPSRAAASDGPILVRGVAASPGSCTGRVRVIGRDRDVDRVEPGDVLVCATADPAWSVLFAIAGALVCDHAGPLSHAAIIARENGIPAVVGTGNATDVLRDGQRVTVDGSAGRVESAPPEQEGGTS
ncbi:PEP/pyruvate-binding domain-containing protein [Microbacterium sp.]|uniref:PEP/pyruvate-binding domain-containing protein n=1 Tax=Microbacterium sp. TaxID=51671 RepID=UPI003A95678A